MVTPSPDLEALKAHAERHKWTRNADAFALIDEVERLRGENASQEIALGQQAVRIANLYADLDKAKRIGAAEILEGAHQWSRPCTWRDSKYDDRAVAIDLLSKVAAELRKEAE
jgi:hypothetical protein